MQLGRQAGSDMASASKVALVKAKGVRRVKAGPYFRAAYGPARKGRMRLRG